MGEWIAWVVLALAHEEKGVARGGQRHAVDNVTWWRHQSTLGAVQVFSEVNDEVEIRSPMPVDEDEEARRGGGGGDLRAKKESELAKLMVFMEDLIKNAS